MLFHSPKLDSDDLDAIRLIEEAKASLGYAIQTPQRWTGLLYRYALGRAIQGTNSIEGYNVSVEDAMAAVGGEEPLDADQEAWPNIVGYRVAMTYVIQLADDPHFAYSEGLIRSLHYMMLQHDLKKHPGQWRPGPIFVYDEEKKEQVYEGPDATIVPALVSELMISLQDQNDPVLPMVRAAMAHLNLVMIHPYSDGNGRMARCLQTLVLARAGVPAPPFSSIEEELKNRRREYYDVLAAVGRGSWHPANGTHAWVKFCLAAHRAQADRLLRQSRYLARLWESLELLATRFGLPERAILALADAAMGHKVRNATYRNLAEISNDVASRDLKLLVDAGLLVARGERRGRYYVAAAPLIELRERTREA